MGLISWLLVGAVVGVALSIVLGKGGIVLDLILGAVGGGLGGFVATLFGLGEIGVFAWGNLFIAVAAAAVVLAAWKVLQRAQ